MSRTLSLFCHDCEVVAWIGQSSSQGWYVYFGHPEVTGMIDRFVNAHLGHRVEFNDDDSSMYDMFEEPT